MAFNILIVDDSLLARAALKRIIDMVDLDVNSLHEACTGVEALEVLDSNEVDLVDRNKLAKCLAQLTQT